MAENKGLRINEQIRVREVRLIDDAGEQKGIVSTLEALRMAQDVNLDLVEVIRMQPKINDHDLSFKARHIQDFLDDGDKVKVTIRFRGRELAHTELGLDVLNNVLAKLGGDLTVEKPPAMEGRSMSMTLAPKSKK